MSVDGVTATAVAGVAVGAVGVVLGQTEAITSDTTHWLNAGGGLISLGFAVWYSWWVTTKTIPERDKIHADTISGLVQEFRAESKEQRQIHTTAIEKIDTSMDRLAATIERAITK